MIVICGASSHLNTTSRNMHWGTSSFYSYHLTNYSSFVFSDILSASTTITKTFSPMIGSPTSPSSRDDPAGLLSASASLWPPPWLNLLLAAIIIGGFACLYCKKRCINIYVSIRILWREEVSFQYDILTYLWISFSHFHSQQLSPHRYQATKKN